MSDTVTITLTRGAAKQIVDRLEADPWTAGNAASVDLQAALNSTQLEQVGAGQGDSEGGEKAKCETCGDVGTIRNPDYCDCIMQAHCHGAEGKDGKRCRLQRFGGGTEGAPSVAAARRRTCPSCDGTATQPNHDDSEAGEGNWQIIVCKVCGEQMDEGDHGYLACACKGWGSEIESDNNRGVFDEERHELVAVVRAQPDFSGEAEQFYCNKCGFVGSDGERWGGGLKHAGCSYLAAPFSTQRSSEEKAEPEKCPTCGSDDPAFAFDPIRPEQPRRPLIWRDSLDGANYWCPDDFHASAHEPEAEPGEGERG